MRSGEAKQSAQRRNWSPPGPVESPDQTERRQKLCSSIVSSWRKAQRRQGAQTPKLDTRASAVTDAETARLERRPRCLQAATAAAARCPWRRESGGRNRGWFFNGLHRNCFHRGRRGDMRGGDFISVLHPPAASTPAARSAWKARRAGMEGCNLGFPVL